MSEPVILEENIKTAAEKIIQAVSANGEITSWELKIKLHLSSSLLYLALGWLLHEGKITLAPDQLNYRVKSALKQQI